MRLLIGGLLWLGAFLVATTAQAALNLELTQGIFNQIPIALMPFSDLADAAETSELSRVISNDLTLSGQFAVCMPTKGIVHTPEQVSASYWRHQQIDNVLVGQIKPIKGQRYRVHFALLTVVRGYNQVVLQQSFTIKQTQLRRLAHYISDQVYEKLTGIKGIFSTRIAYILVKHQASSQRYYNLQIADIDGFNAKTLLTSTQPIMSPAWSHDGKRLAYVSFEHVLPNVYVQVLSTGKRTLISRFPGINGAPAWSPDDTTLALALSKNTDTPKIFSLTLADNTIRQLTFGASIDTEPSWSKDGHQLLFTSDRGGGPQIYQLNLKTGAVERLSFQGNYNARASYSPDGKRLVLLNQEQGLYNIGIQELHTDTALRRLTHSGYNASPSFSPNGQMVLYETKSEQQGYLGITSLDGRINMRLPALDGDVQDPSWSPFFTQ